MIEKKTIYASWPGTYCKSYLFLEWFIARIVELGMQTYIQYKKAKTWVMSIYATMNSCSKYMF